MKILKLVLLLTLVGVAVCQTTPNINLNIPARSTVNWDALLNANFTNLDLLLSGNAALPALSVGAVTMSGSGKSAAQLDPMDLATVNASYPCNSTNDGMLVTLNDSTTNTSGATVSGGGSFHVLIRCNGTNWTVTMGVSNCGPPTFSCSSQSTAVATTPPLPFLASAAVNTTGYAYSSPTDFFYPSSGKGNCFTRLTNSTSASNRSMGSSWSGGASNNMADVNGAFRGATDGNNFLFYHTHKDSHGCNQVDSPMADSTLGGSSGGGFTFSRVTPALAYKISGKNGDGLKTNLYKLSLAYSGGIITVTSLKIFNYNNCPGMDGTLLATAGAGNLNVDSADSIFSTSLNFLPGGQDHAHWVLAWRKSDGACTTYYTGQPQNIITPVTPTSASSSGGVETIGGSGFTFLAGDVICVQGMTPSTLNVCGQVQTANSTTVTLPNAATATGTVMGTFGKTESQWSGNIWGWCIGNCSQHGSNPAPLALNTTCDTTGLYGIHDTQGFHDGAYIDISGKCDPTVANNFTAWQLGANHVTTCNSTIFDCGGHNTVGYHKTRMNNVNWTIRDESDYTTFTTYATGSVLGMDHHGSTNWSGAAADVNPTVWETQPTSSALSCTVAQPYACELVAFRLNDTIARFSPTYHILDPAGDLGPILSLDQDGHCIVFQSNWNQTLGTDSTGGIRRDLFSVCELQ